MLIVNLDLHGPAASYDALYAEIRRQGTWWHYMRWTWIIQTSRTPDQVVDSLKPFITGPDRLLVTYLTRPYQGLLSKEEWAWINERINKQL